MIRHKQYSKLDPEYVEKKLKEFFKEDNIGKDITTKATQKNEPMQAYFIAKEELVFAGKEIIIQAFKDCNINQIQEDQISPDLLMAQLLVAAQN